VPAEGALMGQRWDLSGRRMVITGAARGLGRALAIVAADHGAQPVLLARNQAAVREVAASMRLTNREVVEAVLFALSAPRVCAYSSIVLGKM
jgi:3-oxoacyl-[acyl-carrier protein] reductase